MGASLKGSNPVAGGFKNAFKTRNIFGFEGHFYDSYKHLDKIDKHGVSVIQTQQGSRPAHGVHVAFINGQLDISGGIKQGQQVSGTPPLPFFSIKIDNITVFLMELGQFFIPRNDGEISAFPEGLEKAIMNI